MTVIHNPVPTAAAGGLPSYTTGVAMGGGGCYTGGGVGVFPLGGGGQGGGFIINHGTQFDFSHSAVSISSSEALRLNLNGKPVPQGPKFTDCLDLFVVDLKLDGSGQNLAHYQVWIDLHGEDYGDYGVVLRSEVGVRPAFGSQETRNHFVEWFDRYKRTFFPYHDPSEHYWPKLASGDVKGVWIEDRPSDEFVSHSVDWTFIAGNCHHPVVRAGNGWLFQETADAICFKMR